jgi:Translation initiation factor 1 (eIF-1/SUI1) and related proteins
MNKLVWTSDPEEAKKLRESGPKAVDAPPTSQKIKVSLDRRRRKGKTVTVAAGFDLTPRSLDAIARDLKKRCGAGGSAKDGEIEIQGEHLEAVMGELARRGFGVKRSGG